MQNDFEQYLKWAGVIQATAISKKSSACEPNDLMDLLERYHELCESLAELMPDDPELQELLEHSAELESTSSKDFEKLLDELIAELEKLKAKIYALYFESLKAEEVESEETVTPQGLEAESEHTAPHRASNIVFVKPSAEALLTTAMDEQMALKKNEEMQMQAQSAMGM